MSVRPQQTATCNPGGYHAGTTNGHGQWDHLKYLEVIVARVLESQERIESALQTLSSDVRTGFNEVKLDTLRGAKIRSESAETVHVTMMPTPSSGFQLPSPAGSTAALKTEEDKLQEWVEAPPTGISTRQVSSAVMGVSSTISVEVESENTNQHTSAGALLPLPANHHNSTLTSNCSFLSALQEPTASSKVPKLNRSASAGSPLRGSQSAHPSVPPSSTPAKAVRRSSFRTSRGSRTIFPMRTTFDCSLEQLPSMWNEDDGTFDIEVEQLDAGEEQEDEVAVVSKYVLDPTSKVRMVLDLLSLLFLGYDLVMTPYIIAWQQEWTGFIQWATYFTLMFWTCDIAFSFRTGYWDGNGQLEMGTLAIATHYLKTFFIVDLSAVASDLATVIINTYLDGRGGEEIARFAKAARLLRLLGIVRISRLEGIMARLCDRYPKLRSTGIVLGISKILLVILYINHMIACAWYFLGSQVSPDTGSVWLDNLANSPAVADTIIQYRDAGFWYQYFTSFHFSLTQMTPGSMQVFPVNTYERMFNSGCLILGLLTFSTLISQLSGKIMQSKNKYEEHHKKFGTLHRFLRESGVSRRLAISVEQEVKSRLQQSSLILSYCNVDTLKMLSPEMRADLKYGLCRQQLLGIAFFKVAGHMTPRFLRRLCRDSVDFSVVAQGDHIFEEFKKADNLFYLLKGGIDYALKVFQDNILQPHSSESESEAVYPGHWLSEACLWCHWEHLGTAKATSGVSIMKLRVAGFEDAVQDEPLLQELAWEYTVRFHQIVTNCVEMGQLLRLDDLRLGVVSYDEVVLMCQPVVRTFFSLVGVSILQRRHVSGTFSMNWTVISKVQSITASSMSVTRLEQEVRESKCSLVICSNGDIQRVTVIGCMQVIRPDGRIWVQLARVRDDKAMATCTLPWIKMKDNLNVSEAMDEIRKTELSFMARRLRMGSSEKSSKMKYSDAYLVHTKYVRHVQIANILDDEAFDYELPSVPAVTMPSFSMIGALASIRSPAEFRSESTNRTAPPTPAVDEFFLNSDGHAVYVSTWLTLEEFEYFCTSAGSAYLSKWLQNLRVDDGLVQAAHDVYKSSIRVFGSNRTPSRSSGPSRTTNLNSPAFNGERSQKSSPGLFGQDEYAQISAI